MANTRKMFYSWKTFYPKFENSLNFTFSSKMEINDSAVFEWRKQLCACVEAKGGQFEYKL